tara:strand:+ start:37344 stop:37733 length:390 start_codon:yes stop_codon:yes gene_type:complete
MSLIFPVFAVPNNANLSIEKQVNGNSKVKQAAIHRSILSDIIPQLALALGFVLIVIFAGAYLNNKLGFFNKYTSNKLQVEAVLSLSAKNKLILVNTEYKKYLLSVTQNDIKKIDSYDLKQEQSLESVTD